jgi:hypothetical protein
MQPSTALHALIQTLTQAEKRYLRMYAGRHVVGEENQYMLLFDAVQQQTTYDEAAIKAEWEKSGTDVKNFPSIKNYLFNLVLRAMREFHRDAHPLRMLEEQLEDVEFLQQRGLQTESAKLLQKAKEKAYALEAYHLLLRIYPMERVRVLATQADLSVDHISAIDDEMRTSLGSIKKIAELEALSSQLILLTKKHFRLRGDEAQEQVRALREHPQLASPPEEGKFLAQFHYHRCLAALRQLEGDPAASRQHRDAIYDLWQAFPNMRKAMSSPYILSLSNLLATCFFTRDYDKMPELIAALAAATPQNAAEAIEIRQNAGFYRLSYFMNAHQWDAIPAAIAELEAVLKAHSGVINQARLLAIRYNIAIAHFFLEQHSPALHALNAILHDQQSQHRLDIQQATRLMQAVVHFQLGNLDLLDYLLRSVRRYLQARGALHEFEETLISGLKRLAGNPSERLPILTRLQAQLALLREDPQNAEAPGLQEVQYWVQAQIEGVPLRFLLP